MAGPPSEARVGAALVEELDLAVAPGDLARALGPGASLAWLDRRRPYRGETAPSVLGFMPAAVLEARAERLRAFTPDGVVADCAGDPLEFLGSWTRRTAFGGPAGCGWIGFLGYGLGAVTEGLRSRHPAPFGLPDFRWILHDPLLVHDPETGRWRAVAHGFDPVAGGPCERRARERIAHARRRVARALAHPAPVEAVEARELRSNLDWPAYRERIERLRALLEAGDLYQANLAQRFSFRTGASGLALHERLAARTPTAFASYLHGGDWELTVHTPERFLRRRGEWIETDPIKGTRPRGKDAAEDRALVADLLADPKEAAEHVMIVDLERNDLGRLCRYGTVRVTHGREVHTLPTLHHLVSCVEGRLREGVELPEILRATFPGGSITGAPKRRAMEVIDALETGGRGPYTGAVGWIDLNGDFDLAMIIRAAVRVGAEAHYWAGGGIVYESDPRREYEESRLKALGFVECVRG